MAITPEDASERASELWERYHQTGNLEDLQEAITYLEHAVFYTPLHAPAHAMYLDDLGIALVTRYKHTKDLDDLQWAIDHFHLAVDLTLNDSPERARYLNNLASGLRVRYGLIQDLADLQQVIASYQQVVALTPATSPDRAASLYNLAIELSARYLRIGDLVDLEQAIDAYQQAVALTSEDSPERAMYLHNLVIAMANRYDKHTKDLANLQQAITSFQQAVALTPEDSPERAMYLTHLADGLRDYYSRTWDLADLQQAIDAYQQAVALTPKDSPEQVGKLNNLANGLRNRYERTRDFADLQQAIDLHQQAVALTPETSPERASSLHNLANGLRDRYKAIGDLVDLQQMNACSQQAVALTPEDSPNRAMYLTSLANGLSDRFHRIGDLADLQQVIACSQQAVALTPEDAPKRAMYLNNLADGLRDYYSRTWDLAELQQAIDASQQAVALTPEDSPERAMYLHNLAVELGVRYVQTRDLADLQQAIDASQQAVALTLENAPHRASYLSNLANVLRNRYIHTRVLADLQQAIAHAQQAIALIPETSPDRVLALCNLAVKLSDRYGAIRDLADLQQAIESYQQACERGLDVAAEESLRSACNWKNWAFERQAWGEAEQASNYARQAIKQLLKIQLVRQSQESWLREIQGLAADAAYATAKTGELESAVVAIEEGCARLLAEALERNRRDLEGLNELGHADLYESYQAKSGRLNQLQVATQPQPEGIGRSTQPSTKEIRQAKADLDSVINQIQQIPGYQDFLADPEFDEIAEVVQPDNPLVYLVTTTAGSLALIVHKSVDGLKSSQVTPTWLNEFTSTDLRDLLGYGLETEQDGWFTSYKRYIEAQDFERKVAQQNWLDTINRVTQVLWTKVMNPVVQALHSIGAEQAVLIPTGLFGFLPLHAAWVEDPNSPTGRRYALDVITFTYAPNARSLQADYAMADQSQSLSLLAVNEPRPVRASALACVEAEVQTAMAAFAKKSKEFKHEQATLANIVEALKAEYSVLHFACHGQVNFAEPLESGLLIANDEFLTLRAVLNLRMQDVRLAVLSACETGISGEELPDEVVSLPSGLLQAGVAGIVASLWSVEDLATAMLLVRFYDLWRGKEQRKPHQALHQAQQWLRDTTNGEKMEFFDQFKENRVDGVIPPGAATYITSELFRRFTDDQALDFAHPFQWAAFNFVGV